MPRDNCHHANRYQRADGTTRPAARTPAARLSMAACHFRSGLSRSPSGCAASSSLRGRCHLSTCNASWTGVSLAITAASSCSPGTAAVVSRLLNASRSNAPAAHCPAQPPWVRNQEISGLATVRTEPNMTGSTSPAYLSCKGMHLRNRTTQVLAEATLIGAALPVTEPSSRAG
jgi:hypothetical protein